MTGREDGTSDVTMPALFVDESQIVVAPHDHANILGGNWALIQHMIALGHCCRGTPSGGPHCVAGFGILLV